jgi:hypothetical protein
MKNYLIINLIDLRFKLLDRIKPATGGGPNMQRAGRRKNKDLTHQIVS